MADRLKLYSYWRSSAAYRVRIALNLKELEYDTMAVHLVRNGGEQHSEDFDVVNPQHLVPVLIDGGRVIRQSMAIIEYLEEVYSGTRLLPATARERARARSIAQIVACDIHPLNNLRVLQYLEHEFSAPQAERDRWIKHWMVDGFAAIEALLVDSPSTGTFCEGDTVSMADICLVPQIYNARRFGVDMSQYPTITRIEAECLGIQAFADARPEAQPDAPASA